MRSPQPDKRHDIVAVPENTADGCDFIIGDVHGSSSTLKSVCKLLKNENDRLFIVGDLTDRGEDSIETIRFIHQFNASRPSGKIHSIRGNHEDLCLAAIKTLEQLTLMQQHADDYTKMCMYILSRHTAENKSLGVLLANKTINHFTNELIAEGERIFKKMCGIKPDKKISLDTIRKLLSKQSKLTSSYHKLHDAMLQHYNDIINHSLNGGRWLSELYIRELTEGRIRIANNNILYGDSSDTSMIKHYMNSLPYIMYVAGDHPFIVVHADLPMNADELQKRIHSGSGLSPSEIEYATLARAGDRTIPIREIAGRNQFSIPCYVGHSVKGGIRPETNTFNLDIGAYHTNALLVVNHTKNTCLTVQHSNEKMTDSLDEILTKTQELLDQQNMLAASRNVNRRLHQSGDQRTKVELTKSPSSYFHHSSQDNLSISASKYKPIPKK